jgi:iron(III) transport system substrate-binding protein
MSKPECRRNAEATVTKYFLAASNRDDFVRTRMQWISLLLATFATLISGCKPEPSSEVVVYTALDEGFSRPIFGDFEAETGVEVRPKFDTEATKTVGLAQTILAEKERPRCDLFWNNEILNTLRLERAGLLREYRSPAAEAFPAFARSPSGTWHGFAARARVLIVNTERLAEDQRPTSVSDLRDAKWKGRCGIAKPLFGTTATHAAVLFATLGEDTAKEFFYDVKANAQVFAGNKQVALAVAAGQIDWGITDTDDAIIEIESAKPVTIVYPDQGEGQPGTLFIPNTLALIKGSPNPEAAEKLVDYLLAPAVEEKLAAGPSAQIPLNPAVDVELRVESPKTVRPMQVDWQAAADQWDAAYAFLTEEFAAVE